jgi:hypothetical protein
MRRWFRRMRAVLTEEQLARYDRLRGYGRRALKYAGELRLPEPVGTQTSLMLRRRLLALLLCLYAAGFAIAGEAAHAAIQSDQPCMQQAANAGGDCGGDGMSINTCVAYCAAGACVVSAVPPAQSTLAALPPATREAVLISDCRSAPETAPPKAALP